MTTWQGLAFTMVVQVTAVSLAALAWTACSARSPARRHTIGMVSLSLILGSPFLVMILPQAGWWRQTFANDDPTGLTESARDASSQNRDEQSTLDESVSRNTVFDRASGPSFESQGEGSSTASVNHGEIQMSKWIQGSKLGDLAGFLWLAGSMVSAGQWMWQCHRLRWLVRSLELVHGRPSQRIEKQFRETRGPIESTVREATVVLDLREFPAVATSICVPMPLVLGVWDPLIVVPHDLLQSDNANRLSDVLIHEGAHVARRDPLVNLGQRAAAVLWWWHPGVVALNRAIARSREEVCDNIVLCHRDASHYAVTLLEVAERCSEVGRWRTAIGLLTPRWTLESRIAGLLKPGRDTMTRTRRHVLIGIATGLGAVCLMIGGVRAVNGEKTLPKTGAPAGAIAGAPEESASVTEQLKVVVRGQCVDDDSKPLADVRVIILRRSDFDGTNAIVGETRTDEAGRFELPDVETTMSDRPDLSVATALTGKVSRIVPLPLPEEGVIQSEITLGSDPGTLSGIVSDVEGRPISGVNVYLPCMGDEPLPGIFCAVTDENGRYSITDLKRWTPESTRTFDPKTKLGSMTSACSFLLSHPDFPTSMAMHTAVPQVVDVTLYPPAIVEGQVMDTVTNQPAAHVRVCAQGIARHGWYRTRTDAAGRYRLLMTRDHYNIWADAADRIAIAVKALQATPGQKVAHADIRLYGGGFVVGTVFDAQGQPVSPTKKNPSWGAHYGPARPRTGAAVTSTIVQADGTYRLRVAPGKNFIYSMNDSGSSGIVAVEDGKEVLFDIHLGTRIENQPEDEDMRLSRELRDAAEREDKNVRSRKQ